MISIEGLAQSLRRNPEGLLLLGAGVALLLRNVAGNGKPDKRRARAKGQPSADEKGEGVMSRLSGTADDMRERVSGAAETIGQGASRLRKSAWKQSRSAAGQARRTVDDLVESHPIAVSLGGLAAGCLAAAVFPPTRVEQTALAPIGQMAEDAAFEAAAEAKRQVADAAARAGEELATAAANRLLDVEADASAPASHGANTRP
jgi:hypothetical protein